MQKQKTPVPLDHAGAWRVYLGGRRIRRLRGLPGDGDDHFPEEWIASTTEAAGAGAVPGAGLSRLRNHPERTLRELIASNPTAFLGERFFRRYGGNCGVLLKLLDAAERLNVQVHPNRGDARRFWQLPFGKMECWHFLDARKGDGGLPVIYLGLKENVTPDLLRRAFESGDSQRVLDCMHRFPAATGETVLIEGGVPHAIGPGCFLLEIQEPSDLTLRLEKTTTSGTKVPDELCHMGIGYDAMFSLIRFPGLSSDEVRAKWFVPSLPLSPAPGGQITHLLDYNRCPYFAMEQIDVWDTFRLPQEPVFYGLFTLSGEGELSSGYFHCVLGGGDQLFIPAECPPLEIRARSPLRLIRFLGPKV